MIQGRTRVDPGMPVRGSKSKSLAEILHVYVGLLGGGDIYTFDSLGGGGISNIEYFTDFWR